MLLGDIPIFFSKTDSADLIASNGTVIPNYFLSSSYDIVVKRIEELTEEEINRQLAQIKVSLGLFPQEYAKHCHLLSQISTSLDTFSMDREELLLAAEEIGQQVIETMVQDSESYTVNWNNIAWDGANNCWKVRPLDENLQTGLAGVLTFYIQLSRISTNPVFEETVDKLFNSLLEIPDFKIGWGTHSGIGSSIYPLLLLAKDKKQKICYQKIYQITKTIIDNIDQIERPDFISKTMV